MGNEVIEALLSHRSVRRFQERAVEPELVERILRAGVRGATSYGLQNYTLLVVDDAQKKAALGLEHAPLVVIALVDQYRLSRWFGTQRAGPSRFNGAHNLFIAFWDAIIALQNVVVAAESLGLGTCYYGHVLGVDVQSLFGTPEYVVPAGMVAMGHPAEHPALTPRMPLEAVVHHNRYAMPSDEDIRRWHAHYEAEWDALSEEEKARLAERGIRNSAQRMAAEGCSDQVIEQRSADILRNLRRARFVLSGEPSCE